MLCENGLVGRRIYPENAEHIESSTYDRSSVNDNFGIKKKNKEKTASDLEESGRLGVFGHEFPISAADCAYGGV